MKIRAISKGKLTLLLTAFCAVILASSDDAKAIGYRLPRINLASGDQHALGQVLPGLLVGDADREQYVNFMIGLPLGGSDHVMINGQDSLVMRSNNDFGALLGPATLALTGERMTVNLGTQSMYDYLLVRYNGPNAVSEVWHVGDLTGRIIIPAIRGEHGLPSWALFTSGPESVPDGGATVMMLGAALGTLGVMRRYLIGR
jgi:protein with PEP-CTERM/exosortase system signal